MSQSNYSKLTQQQLFWCHHCCACSKTWSIPEEVRPTCDQSRTDDILESPRCIHGWLQRRATRTTGKVYAIFYKKLPQLRISYLCCLSYCTSIHSFNNLMVLLEIINGVSKHVSTLWLSKCWSASQDQRLLTLNRLLTSAKTFNDKYMLKHCYGMMCCQDLQHV